LAEAEAREGKARTETAASAASAASAELAEPAGLGQGLMEGAGERGKGDLGLEDAEVDLEDDEVVGEPVVHSEV
jgi:hypothetical protein